MVSVAVHAGATAIGLMIAQSRRQVSQGQAAALAASISAAGAESVAVVVDLAPGELVALREVTGVDVIQLSGDESPELLNRLEGRYWKALRFPAGTTVDTARSAIENWLGGARPVEAVLIDASVAGAFGGTGHRADWELVSRLTEDYPLILAGGLNPDNVSDAVAATGVVGVDVSSGVERDGTKNADLIRAFVGNAKVAFS